MSRLRPYQEKAIADVAAVFDEGARAICLQIPTGGGKTRAAAELLLRETNEGRTGLFLAHLDTLLDDTHARLAEAGVWAGFVQAGRRASPLAKVQVCSLQTLHARPHERPAADLVIIDEAHRAVAASVRGVLRAYPSARILGVTATPARADGRPLGDVFERLVEGPSTAWLIEHGYLVPCDVIAPPNYVERGLFADPVEAYQRHAPGARAIVFAASVAHAENLTQRFTAAGVPAECITGETSRVRRLGVRERITTGELRVLVGVSVFLEGFDCPAIDCVILARGFGVTGAYLQAIGRGLRPSPETGKTKCTVIDLRGAVHLHGLPDEARRWALTGEAVRRTEALTAMAHCRECLALFRPASRCPRCGARLGVVTRLPRNLSRAEKLEKVSALPPSTRDLRYFAQLERVARVRLRLPPEAASRWALGRFRTRFGREPMFEVTQ